MNNLLIKNPAKGPGAKIYFCKVIRFLPSSNTIDCVTIDNNISLLNCNVACSTPAGFAYGSRYFPHHDDQNPEAPYVNSPGDIYCVAAFLENDYNNAAVLGFLFPMETTLSIAEYGLYIFRHESDVIWMVRADGTMQIYHPSGSIVKIGDDDSNEVDSDRDQAGLYPAKTDGLYVRSSADYNAEKETNLFIRWHKGQEVTLDNDGNAIVKTKDTAGAVKTTLTMTPDGDITVTATNDITVNAGRDIHATATRDIHATAFGDMTAGCAGSLYAQGGSSAVVTTNGNATLHAMQDVNITSEFGDINMIASAGEINVRAPLNKVVVGGTGVGGSAATNKITSYT